MRPFSALMLAALVLTQAMPHENVTKPKPKVPMPIPRQTAADYRTEARRLRERAQSTTDHTIRSQLLTLATDLEKLADIAELSEGATT
jgi:hypothetical protein